MAALRPEADDARLRHPAGLRGVLRITAALAMLGTLSLGVAGLAAGCLVVVLTGWSEAGLGATTWAGGAGLLLGAGLIGVGLVLRDDAIDLPEVRVDLDPAVEAAVWTEVHAAAAAVGARLPDRIFLVPGVTCSCAGRPGCRRTARPRSGSAWGCS